MGIKKLAISSIAILAIATSIGCKKSSGVDNTNFASTSSASQTLTVNPNPGSVVIGSSLQINPQGGVSPYTYTIVSGGGQLSTTAGPFTTYTPPGTAGVASVQIVDSASNRFLYSINITGASLTINPANPTVAPGGQIQFTATGGSGNYTFAASSGSFSSNVYTAPSTAGTYIVQVTDTASNATAQTNVTVGGSSSNTTSCEGNYNVTVGGLSGTMLLIQDSSGQVMGNLYLSNTYFPISGVCSVSGSGGSITFNELVDAHQYTGSLSYNGSQISISGSVAIDGTNVSWQATSTSTLGMMSAPSQTCQGNFNANIAGTAGTISLLSDGAGNIAGFITESGYVFELAGTCNLSTGQVQFTNLTRGSTYSGTVSVSNSTVSMSGTFNYSGQSYSWSAQ